MAKPAESEEPDYLAGTQLEESPTAFAALVREAFALEYQATKDGLIAEIIGRDKSRMSQIFRDPAVVESSTIRHLTSFIHNPELRRRIVEAWAHAYFKLDINPSQPGRYLGETANESTRRRVDRLIRQGQLALAARVSLEAVMKTSDVVLQEELLDRASFALQRIDQPGQAMRVAKRIAERARSRGDIRREVGATVLRCRILLGLTNTKPEEVFSAIDGAEALLHTTPEVEPTRYIIGSPTNLRQLREAALVTFMERGAMPLQESQVRTILAQSVEEAKRAKPYQARFKGYYFAARCATLLGERFLAEELLERAFKAGNVKNLHAYEASGVLMANILALSDASPEHRGDYLVKVTENCTVTFDRYHQRLAEWELARIEASQFPSRHPELSGDHRPDHP